MIPNLATEPSVQLPIEPSALGVPMSWHPRHPVWIAAGSFQHRERVRGAIHGAGMVPLAEGDLLSGQLRRPAHGCPGRQPVPTAGELLVFGPVARLTVQRRDRARQHEVVVLDLVLTLEPLVAVVARDVGLAVLTAFELVDDRRGLFPVALRASPRGLHEGWEWLARLTRRSRAVDYQSPQDQAAPDDDRDEDRPERHPAPIARTETDAPVERNHPEGRCLMQSSPERLPAAHVEQRGGSSVWVHTDSRSERNGGVEIGAHIGSARTREGMSGKTGTNSPSGR